MYEGISQPGALSEHAALPATSQGDTELLAVSIPGKATADAQEQRLLEALRGGDEAAFVSLIERYSMPMLHLAKAYVSRQAVAEEVVQEAWMGVLQGLQRFEGRSSLKTWIFRILTNCARTRAVREGRSVPFSALADMDIASHEPAVEPERFRGPDQPWPGHWVSFPRDWDSIPEERVLSQETYACISQSINSLPASQRVVITLRDIEGWSTEEISQLLSISEGNLRVLLHRARSKVRRALEKYFEEE